MTEDDLDAMMDAADTNGNGLIEYNGIYASSSQASGLKGLNSPSLTSTATGGICTKPLSNFWVPPPVYTQS